SHTHTPRSPRPASTPSGRPTPAASPALPTVLPCSTSPGPPTSTRYSTNCSGSKADERQGQSSPHRQRLGVDLRDARTVRPGDRPHREGFPPRHLPQPDRGDQLRADDGRLRLVGNAHQLPPLVLRQALHSGGKPVPQGPPRPRLRN